MLFRTTRRIIAVGLSFTYRLPTTDAELGAEEQGGSHGHDLGSDRLVRRRESPYRPRCARSSAVREHRTGPRGWCRPRQRHSRRRTRAEGNDELRRAVDLLLGDVGELEVDPLDGSLGQRQLAEVCPLDLLDRYHLACAGCGRLSGADALEGPDAERRDDRDDDRPQAYLSLSGCSRS